MAKLRNIYHIIFRLLVCLWLCGYTTEAWGGNNMSAFSYKPYVADTILTHIFHSASVYAKEVGEYKADLYLKGRLQIHKQNKIIKYVPSMFRFEKGVNDYIHESISELHYTAPRIYDRKIRAVSTTFIGGDSRFFDIMEFVKFNIYAPSLMEDKLLSPLNEQSSVHYYYLLDSVDYWKAGEVYKIRVIPRYRSTQLLEGFFWISTKDWTIRYLNFYGKYDLTRFHLAMRMGETEETRCLPQLINLDIVFKFCGIIWR